MNTGFRQAKILYKITPSGEPVDAQGNLTKISGRRQAVALLDGFENPDPNRFEEVARFGEGATIWGVPTSTYDANGCPVSVFFTDKDYIVLHPGKAEDEMGIYSSYGWGVQPFNFSTFSPPRAGRNSTKIKIKRTNALGQGWAEFKEDVTGKIVKIYIVNTDALGWILTTGKWNDLRFWDNLEKWKYGN